MDLLREALHTCVVEGLARRARGAFKLAFKVSDVRDEPFYCDALRLIEGDQEIKPRLGSPIDCLMGGISRLESRDVLEGFVSRCLGSMEDAFIDEQVFDAYFGECMDLVRRGVTYAEVSAPIERLTCQGGPHQIGEYTLRFTTAEEFAQTGSPRFILTRRVLCPPVKKDAGQEHSQFAKAFRQEVREIIDLVKVLTRGRISVPYVRIALRWPSGAISSTSSVLSPFYGAPGATTLYLEQIQKLRSLFQNRHTLSRYALAALKRYGVSRDEFDPDERVTVLMSAAEALFLGGDKGDNAYKLAMRGAFFTQCEVPRRAVFRVLGAAYKIRSKIAHGDSAEKEKRPDFAGNELAPLAFADLIDDVVGRAILRAIEAGVPNWDDLIFEDSERRDLER